MKSGNSFGIKQNVDFGSIFLVSRKLTVERRQLARLNYHFYSCNLSLYGLVETHCVRIRKNNHRDLKATEAQITVPQLTYFVSDFLFS